MVHFHKTGLSEQYIRLIQIQMDIIAFRTFLAAAETGSFAGAAQRVNASPSSVTERIKQLEHHLGARLFD
ncbi:MAG: LysR family transcriptional regulator, partial [Parasphingorhabdus sp.]|uniref:LysR family transcriptional regulator n=1 Tax=Parasphingorhabdus sp. TaxID=2709688 RepID=UPI003002D7FA